MMNEGLDALKGGFIGNGFALNNGKKGNCTNHLKKMKNNVMISV